MAKPKMVRVGFNLLQAKALADCVNTFLDETPGDGPKRKAACKAAELLDTAILVAEKHALQEPSAPDAEALVAEAQRLLRKAQEVCKHVRWKREEDAGGIMPYYWRCQTCGHETYRPPASVEVEKGVRP